jgi:hypothetical protein
VTTYTPFLPTATAPFQFTPTLDGALHTLVVTWGLAGQRWYVNLYDQTGALVFYLPLIASPSPAATASLTYDGVTQLATVTTASPHNLKIGSIVEMTVSGVTPSAYNGVFHMEVVSGPSMLKYPLTTDPGGPATSQGSIGRDINIAGGYFQTSTLIFRDATQQFEVNP